ncbi:MAG: hypothetical protein V4474_01880 [Patescibacteria group bacterium]
MRTLFSLIGKLLYLLTWWGVDPIYNLFRRPYVQTQAGRDKANWRTVRCTAAAGVLFITVMMWYDGEHWGWIDGTAGLYALLTAWHLGGWDLYKLRIS